MASDIEEVDGPSENFLEILEFIHTVVIRDGVAKYTLLSVHTNICALIWDH